MTTTAITQDTGITTDALESILVDGNLDKLTPAQRLDYYAATCKSLGLNPLTKPFAYIRLNGKTTLYALKETTDQLRKNHGISVRITAREMLESSYVVTAFATDRDGRTDESTGAVPMTGLQGEAHSNALMKAETKAKRRVTLSIAGLGMLDETEVGSITDAETNVVDLDTGEFLDAKPARKTRATNKVTPSEIKEAVAQAADQMQAEAEAIKMAAEVVMVTEDEGPEENWQLDPESKSCEEHGVAFALRTNPATGESRWVHEYSYTREGETEARTGWCVAP